MLLLYSYASDVYEILIAITILLANDIGKSFKMIF